MNILDSKLALYIVKRLLLALFTVFLVITITFFAMKAIPGGPFLSEKAATPAVTAALEAGVEAAQAVGNVMCKEVIARPHPDIVKFIKTDEGV